MTYTFIAGRCLGLLGSGTLGACSCSPSLLLGANLAFFLGDLVRTQTASARVGIITLNAQRALLAMLANRTSLALNAGRLASLVLAMEVPADAIARRNAATPLW